MEKVNDKYYIGYEGYPEIQFMSTDESVTDKLIIWEGFFDEIMSKIQPSDQGWTGLAYHYHMCTGWNENSPWEVDNPRKVLEQLEEIDKQGLDKETVQVLEEICRLFSDALNADRKIFIESDQQSVLRFRARGK